MKTNINENVKKVMLVDAEYQAILALYDTRNEVGLTQKDLAKISGIRQSNISRIESGMCSPTIHTLASLALAMGKKLEIRFK